MGTNNYTDYSSTPVAQSVSARFDQYYNGLVGDVVPRNSSGVPTDLAGKLGTQTFKWDEVNTRRININGTPFDPNNLLTDLNQVNSGATRSASEQPLFLQADGSTNELTILATATDLELTIGGNAVTFDTDVDVTSLTVAPSTNNTCLIDDANLSDQEFTKYITNITYDTAGSEITSLDGEFAAFSVGSTEYFIAKIDNTNNVLKVYQRGFFFDSSNNPIESVTLANNDTITLMQLAWIYADNSGSSASVGYTTPTYSASQPASAVLNDYWFDLSSEEWKRYDGAAWQVVNRILIGYAVIDSSNCVATRCIDFSKQYSDLNTFDVENNSVTTMQSVSDFENAISVYGKNFFYNGRVTWDITADLESGVSEANSTYYYFYITEKGAVKISDIAPNYFVNRRGGYHPFHTWRFIARGYNDSSGDLEAQIIHFKKSEIIIFTEDSFFINPNGVQRCVVYAIGAGDNSNGLAGGSSEFNFDLLAAGGGSGDTSSGDIVYNYSSSVLDMFLLNAKANDGTYAVGASSFNGDFAYKKYSNLRTEYSYFCNVGQFATPTTGSPGSGLLVIQL